MHSRSMSSPPTSQPSIEFKIQNSQVQGQMKRVSICHKNCHFANYLSQFFVAHYLTTSSQFSVCLLQIITVSVCAQHIICQFLQQHNGDILTYLTEMEAVIILYLFFRVWNGSSILNMLLPLFKSNNYDDFMHFFRSETVHLS